MRIKYYKRLFGQMNARKPFVLFVILAIFLVSSSIYIIKRIKPTIKVTCESKAKAIGRQLTEETVKEVIENIKYDSLMDIQYDNFGNIVSLNANIIELNKLSSETAYKIQEKFNALEKITVEVPLGGALGFNIFAGYGPDINIKLVPIGNIETQFNTEFTSEGINQTKHTIYMEIQSTITVVAPFIGSRVKCNSTVTVAETIIVGEIPETYYNVGNLKEATESGVLDTF